MQSVYLRLSITDDCNFRCAYCRPAAGGRAAVDSFAADAAPGSSLPNARVLRLPDLRDLVALVDSVVPVRKVRITGGEPLVRVGVPGLVAELRRLLPDAELCLTTNGSLLARHAVRLREAGLDRLNVSIDAIDPARFAALTGGGAPGPVLEGIAAARAAGFDRIKLNTVLLRSYNGDAIESLARTAATLGCELRFIELMPLGVAQHLPAHEYLPAEEALAALRRAFPYVGAAPPTDTAARHRLRIDGREVTIGFVTPVSKPFCGGCDRLRLDARGRLFACLRRAVGLDLATPVAEGRLAEARQRVAAVAAPKHAPATSWPARDMSTIGG